MSADTSKIVHALASATSVLLPASILKSSKSLGVFGCQSLTQNRDGGQKLAKSVQNFRVQAEVKLNCREISEQLGLKTTAQGWKPSFSRRHMVQPELCVCVCVYVSRGVSLGRVLSGLITPDSCNLQVDSREKSARFTLLRVSICRHYRTAHTAGRSASGRKR